MKKLITLFAAVLMAVGASAETVVDYEKDFTDGSYGMWHSDATDTYTYTPTAGVGFVVENTAAQKDFWVVQYHVAGGLTLTAGTEYTITITLDAEVRISQLPTSSLATNLQELTSLFFVSLVILLEPLQLRTLKLLTNQQELASMM